MTIMANLPRKHSIPTPQPTAFNRRTTMIKSNNSIVGRAGKLRILIPGTHNQGRAERRKKHSKPTKRKLTLVSDGPDKCAQTPDSRGKDDQGLEGRIALVTDANRGLGAAIAVALAEVGTDLVVHYLSGERKAHHVQDTIEGLNRRCLTLRSNISDPEEVREMIRTIEKQLGHISILVNSVSVFTPRALEEIDEGLWDFTLDINLKSAFLLTQAVLPAMKENGWGRIINISSAVWQLGSPDPHYAASMAGLIGLTRSYATILGREGITINAIAPAFVGNPLVTADPPLSPDLTPLGRYGEVDEVSIVALMLVLNGYMNGQTINVNGGIYMT
jgi:3-oxoacyl-[acyl-carrier protein] reductase